MTITKIEPARADGNIQTMAATKDPAGIPHANASNTPVSASLRLTCGSSETF